MGEQRDSLGTRDQYQQPSRGLYSHGYCHSHGYRSGSMCGGGYVVHNKDSMCVCFGGNLAKGPEDTKAWVSLNHSSGEWDILCVDPVILFGLLESHAGVEFSAGVKVFEQHQKLHLKNAGKALAVTATSLERPRIFHRGKPTLVCKRNSLPLSKLGKHSNWDSGGSCLRALLQAKLGAKIGAM